MLDLYVSMQNNAVRQITAAAIERYFDTTHSEMITMADNAMVVNATGAFSQSFKCIISSENYSKAEIAEFKRKLSDYYSNEFGRKYLKENDRQPIDTNTLLTHLNDRVIALQHLYIAGNPNPLGRRKRDQKPYSKFRQ